jgi:hypothetical protein
MHKNTNPNEGNDKITKIRQPELEVIIEMLKLKIN